MTSRERRLVQVLVSLTDTLVSDFDVVDLFYELVESCTDLFNVAQAGLLVSDTDGVLRVAAASSEDTAVVQLLELQNEGGPGMEAFRTGVPARTNGLAGSDTRHDWKEFREAAISSGFQSVVAVPMRLRGQTLGALNLFSTEPGDLAEEEVAIAQALADLATIAILQDRETVTDRTLISQLRTALDSRVVIEQAKGMVAVEAGLGMDAAFARIRDHARNNNKRLRDVAAAIVSGDLKASRLSSAH